MEFLTPYATRDTIKASISNKIHTLDYFMELYKLPSEIIDLYLSDSYMLHLGKCI